MPIDFFQWRLAITIGQVIPVMTVDAGKRVGRPFFPDDPLFFVFLIVFVQRDVGSADHPEFFILDEFFNLTQLRTGGRHCFESRFIEFTRNAIDHIRASDLVTRSFFRLVCNVY